MSADPAPTFVDTNILIYAYDADAGWKHDVAQARLVELWDSEAGVLSAQVLQEFYVTITRKVTKPLSKRAAREVVGTYLAWPLHRPTGPDLLAASELEQRHRLSFWDALIVISAKQSGAGVILSEDMQAGRHFGDISIANPFAGEPPVEPGRRAPASQSPLGDASG